VTVVTLLVAAVVAVVLAHLEGGDRSTLERFGDAFAIGVIVLLNALIGFTQERKAEDALRALRAMGSPTARVLRDARPVTIDAALLVPGDILLLEEGDRVAADVRLLEPEDLLCEEAALTGESASVEKTRGPLPEQVPLAERTNLAFAGCHVVRGRASGVVVATGMQTEIGRIAAMLQQVESPDTPLQRSLRRFGAYVVAGCAVLAAIVLAIGLMRGDHGVGFWILTAVSLAVAAIPEGLPAVTSIVLALGVQRMAKRNALVRRLAAVETLGSADVVCTDKTGTLTQNKMQLRHLWVPGWQAGMDADAIGPEEQKQAPVAHLIRALGFSPAARVGADSAGEEVVSGDPTDVALLEFHRKMLPPGQRVDSLFHSARVLPFDGDRKRATVVAEDARQLVSYTHGAPEAVLADVACIRSVSGRIVSLDPETHARILGLLEAFANRGLRVLAVAALAERKTSDSVPPASQHREELMQRFEQRTELLGLVGLSDPPREEVAEALRRAEQAGVRSVMITGDHPRTARAIAEEIGLIGADFSASALLTGQQIDAMEPAELERVSREVRVVARATASNKLRLVQAMRRDGRVVAMTGDGVNDAPAIKAASIGIAMGRGGTDVTREAADMVLLDDNYATIVAAIEEGRVVYANIKRFIVFLFAVNWGLVLAVLVSALLGWPALLTPTQILWINLITNGLPALALGMESARGDPMQRPPRRQDESIISRADLRHLAFYGTWIGLLGLGVFVWLGGPTASGDTLAVARTSAFCVLALAPLFHAHASRSHELSVFALGVFSNLRLWGASVGALLLQGLAVYVTPLHGVFATTALPASLALALLFVSATSLLLSEIRKALSGSDR
jgi:Ca2+-transporting ATPase